MKTFFKKFISLLVVLVTISMIFDYGCKKGDSGTAPQQSPPESTQGTIIINSTPSGAAVYLDNNNTSKVTPANIQTSAGTHQIKLVLVGYKEWEQSVNVVISQTITINALLTSIQNSEIIVYMRKGFLASIKPDGTNDTLLPIQVSSNPVLSPDGKRIVYRRDDEWCVINFDGTGFKVVGSAYGSSRRDPVIQHWWNNDWIWVPSNNDALVYNNLYLHIEYFGDWLQYWETRISAFRLYFISNNSSTVITRDSFTVVSRKWNLKFSHRFSSFASIAGNTYLYFQRNFDATKSGAIGDWQSYRYNLTNNKLETVGGAGLVSPDGRDFVYADGEIYVNGRAITSNGAKNQNCYWSPDGKFVIFQSDATGRDEIYIIGKDGTGFRRVTKNSGSYPTWSNMSSQ